MKIKKTIFNILLAASAAAMCLPVQAQHKMVAGKFPFQNYRLPAEKRVNDLVQRLTLEEKVAQMLNHAPAIQRLGIPAYDWWNETLHGVARTPFFVTSYPQAIAMAASWDTRSLEKMGDFSAEEGRAIYNSAVRDGQSGQRYWGLTYWTPNINIFRDPRWGRGQETYGEDPFLTASMGKAIVKGLQGEDPVYLKSAACAKHYAVHSGPEPGRHVDNVSPSAYDLWDTYLPAFKELVVNAKVAGVMCAYNAVNSQPCCGNDLLMNDILRKQWKFQGYVTSDCWALDDFFKYHKTHPDASTAAVDALIHSTDIECGNAVYTQLVEAVKKGAVTEAQIDLSVKRLFYLRFKLGMFDPVDKVKYARISESALGAPAHQALALKMARQSIVLLKNADHTLPLNRESIKKIAVIGPNADNRTAVLGNYNGTPKKVITLLEGIRKKMGKDSKVIYEKAINYTDDTLFVAADIRRLLNSGQVKGVKAEYFNNEKLEGNPVLVKTDSVIDHSWAEGQTPGTGVNTVHFSARFSTTLKADSDMTMHFESEGDEGYRVFVNGKVIVNAWNADQTGTRKFKLQLEKNRSYQIVVEYYQHEGNAMIRLRSGLYRKTDLDALSERLKGVDAIIFAGGITPELEGEEMPVSVPGFNGGDRTSILLPAVQSKLMEALRKTGKPVVFVMMTGSAIAVPQEEKNIPAIINAWYGGESAGTAIADVLFGDYNPAGRLPVTFYSSDQDLPAFNNYDMTGRTYRYFTGKPLYPFGYGLSYSTFHYGTVRSQQVVRAGQDLKISVSLTNTGRVAGDEVVQLYISHPGSSTRSPIRALKGFRRIFLKPMESTTVSFKLTPDLMKLVDEQGNSFQPKGKMIVSAGGGQPGNLNFTTSNVSSKIILIN